MASNTSTFTLKLKTEGFAEAQKQSQIIRDNLQAAATAAGQIGTPGPAPTGGSTSSRKAASSAAARPTGAAGASAGAFAGQEVEDYNRLRGTAAAAGGSARDFADQSRGLGGLVRLYATLAANLYAATAAFSALSAAADTSNLIKGLDQLSASSGQNLSALAKDFVKATDGAVSLKESMGVVAKASTAGLSSENIKRLGEVAKKAAQTLGIDTVTAVDRLSRGIVKLEPELLDELGLFTKIGPATEAYARSIGKSALALTDFERRQAFANAVLGEGEKKFGDIAMSANSFTKLTAKLKDLNFVVLDFINKGAIPIVEFLTSNPMALVGVLALIGKSLLGVTIPAVSSWKNNMKAASEQANQLAKSAVDARRSQRAWQESLIGVQVAEKSRLATQEASLRLTELQNKATAAGSKISKGTRDVVAGIDPKMKLETEAQRQAAQKIVDDLEKRKLAAEKAIARANVTPATVAAKTSEIDAINKSTEALKARLAAENEFNRVVNQPRPGWWTAAAADDRKARAQLIDAQKKSITSNALEQQSLNGTVAGFKALWEGMNKARAGQDLAGAAYTDGSKKLGILSSAAVTAGGSLQLIGAGLSAVANAFNKVMMFIAVFTAAFQLLDFYLTKSKKEEEAFTDTTNKLNGSVKVAAASLDEISKKKFLDPKSVQSTANAFSELTENIKKQLKGFADLRAAQSGWDRWWDDAWNRVGKGSEKQLAKSVTDAILASLDLADDSIKPQLQKAYADILKIDVSNRGNLLGGISKLVREDQSKLLEMIPKIEAIGRAFNNSASGLTALDAGLTEISKQIGDINNSLKLTDLQGKLGTSLIAEAERMAKAFETPKNGIIALQKVVSDFNLISLFPPEEADKLAKARSQINALSEAYQKAEVAKREAETRLSTAGTDIEKATARAVLNQATEQFNKIKGETEIAVGKFKEVVTSGIIESAFKKVEVSLKNALVEASIISARSYLSVLSSIGGSTAQQETELKVKELESQKQLVIANYQHANEIIKLRLVAEKQLQIDIMNLALNKRENAPATQADAASARIKAQAILTDSGTEALRKSQEVRVPATMEGQKGIKQLSPGVFYDENKFNALLGQAQATLTAIVKTTAQVVRESEEEYDAAQIRFKQASDAEKEFFKNGKLNAEAVTKAAKETGTFSSQIAKDLIIQSKGLEASLAKLDAQVGAAKFEGAAKLIQQRATREAEPVQQQAQRAETTISRLSEQESLAGAYSEELSLAKQIAEQQLLIAQREKDRININAGIETAKMLIDELDRKGLGNSTSAIAAEKLLVKLEEDLAINQASWAQKRGAIDSKYGQQRRAEADRKADLERDFQDQIKKGGEEREKIAVDTKKQELDGLITAGKLSEDLAARKLAEIAKENQALIYQGQLKEAMMQKEAADRAANSKRAGARAAGISDAEAEKTLSAELTRSQKLFDDRKITLDQANVYALRGIQIAKDQGIETAKNNKLLEDQKTAMDSLRDIGSSLAIVFGELGERLSKAMEGFAQAEQDRLSGQKDIEKKYAKERLDIAEKYKDDEASGYLALQQSQQSQIKETTNLELKTNIQKIGSAKKLFSEKTAAYKILNGLEKVMHIAKMAMWIKETFMDTTRTGVSVANSATRAGAAVIEAGVDGVKAVVKAISGLTFPLNIVAGAATAAVVGALLASIGGKSPPGVSAAGGDSKSSQEVQGSGLRIDPKTGEKVETGKGVFGDPAAKTSSISKSLEVLKDNSIEGITYDNKMVKLLESINKAIGGAAKSIYGITGLRTGTGFGTEEGTKSKGISGLFGSKTTTDIINSGIKIAGNFLNLGLGQGLMQQFETTQKTKKSSGFLGIGGSTNTSIATQFKDLLQVDPKAVQEITTVFEHGAELMMGIGESLGISAQTIKDRLSTVSVDIMASLRGLTGEELQKELTTMFSQAFDDAALAVSPKIIETYKAFGEAPLDTLIRVLDANNKVQDALFSIGKTSIDAAVRLKYADILVSETFEESRLFGLITRSVTETRRLTEEEFKLLSIAITESLVDAAGGLDKFIEQTQFFAENFLTEAERLVPVSQRLDEQFGILSASLSTDLNIVDLSLVDTREEFKQLVLGLDLTNASQRAAYSTLLELAPAFAMVHEEAQNASMSVKEFAQKVFSNETDIFKLQASILEGNKDFLGAYNLTQKSIALTRSAELAELEKLPEAQRTVLISQANYRYSLEDIVSATKLAEQQNKALVESYNLQIKAQQELLSYLDEALGMVIQAVKLQGSSSDLKYAKSLERTIKLQDLTAKYAGAENAQRLTNIIGLQNYIWALEDEQEAKNKYLESIRNFSQAIQKEVSIIDNFISYIDDALGLVNQALNLQGGSNDLAAVKYIERRIKLQNIERQYQGQDSEHRIRIISGIQKYVWALEDEQEARSKYLDALGNFSNAIDQEVSKLESKVAYFDRVLGMITQALDARGSDADRALSKQITRTIELQNIQRDFSGAENKTKRETITGFQKYIWALEDEKEAKDKYLDALGNQVEAAEKEISKLEEVVASYDKLLDQKARIAELTSGSAAVAKLLGRERELANLRKDVSDDIGTALVNNQEYIWALEDEADIKEKLIEQRDKEKQAIEDTISTIEGAIKSLKDYGASLLLSKELTILTPEEQYLEARKTFEDVLTKARTAGTDEESRSAQMEAISKLPDVSNKLLELSRELFASSGNYITDFNVVRQAIEQTSSGLEEQLTDAEKQLKQLEESTAFLTSIDESTKTTADLLIEYAAAQTKTAAAATKADAMSVEQITALKNTAEQRIAVLNAEVERTNELIQSLTEQTLNYEEAQAASLDAQAAYGAASLALETESKLVQDSMSAEAIASALASRSEALSQITVLKDQLTALEKIRDSLEGVLTYDSAKLAYDASAISYGVAKESSLDAFRVIQADVNPTTINEALNYRGTLTTQAIDYGKTLTALTNIETALNNVPTYDEAKLAYSTATTEYGTAKDASLNAYLAIQNNVNAATIAGAVTARENALLEIELRRQLIEGLQNVEANTYAVYQSQQAQFQSLLQTPQQVIISGTNVAALLTTIANNTASANDKLTEVKAVVKDGTIITVTSNADAVRTQTESFTEAIVELQEDYSRRTIPRFLERSGRPLLTAED